jgi:hypothetical protein
VGSPEHENSAYACAVRARILNRAPRLRDRPTLAHEPHYRDRKVATLPWPATTPRFLRPGGWSEKPRAKVRRCSNLTSVKLTPIWKAPLAFTILFAGTLSCGKSTSPGLGDAGSDGTEQGAGGSAGADGSTIDSGEGTGSAYGIYMMSNYGYRNGVFAAPFAPGAIPSPSQIAGLALYVPLAQILPEYPADGVSLVWDWTYLDALIADASGKPFSLALVVGFQAPLPAGFDAACPGCAATFHTWQAVDSTCVVSAVPLIWNTQVQALWSAAAGAIASHLTAMGTYAKLTLVHLPGLSAFDEELRMPASTPAPADPSLCPVATDTTEARYQSLGYVSGPAVRSAWLNVVSAWGAAFPDKMMGASLFPPTLPDFPSWVNATQGAYAKSLVTALAAMFPGRLQLQADMAGSVGFAPSGYLLPEAENFAHTFATPLGWQTMQPGATFVTDDDPSSSTSYYALLQAMAPAPYVEVWSFDVVSFPNSMVASSGTP